MCYIKNIGIVSLAFLVLVILWELIGPIIRPLPLQLDESLGWVLRSNYTNITTQRDLAGNTYQVQFSTNEDSLRTFGNAEKAKLRILVLGDSFTGAPYAGNKEMWFSEMVKKIEILKNLPTESIYLMAAGAGGYGTLQERILLERIIKKAKPDMVILQFCENDYINSHLEWESTQIYRSQIYRRPYLNLDRKISYNNDLIAPIWRNPYLGDSRIFAILDGLITNLQFLYYDKNYGPQIETIKLNYWQKESLLITQINLSDMKNLVKNKPFFITNANNFLNDDMNHKWVQLGQVAGMIPLINPGRIISQDKRHAELFNEDSGHWSAKGNQLYGDAVAAELLQSPVFNQLLIESGL